LELPPEPLEVDADREKLRQIVTDLVENAVKYSPEGGTVTVSASRRDDLVEVRVDDEGIGVPESEQELIFRKFYRAASESRDLSSGGTGLGLFIARELLAAMRGRIWVRARDDEGTDHRRRGPDPAPVPGQPRGRADGGPLRGRRADRAREGAQRAARR